MWLKFNDETMQDYFRKFKSTEFKYKNLLENVKDTDNHTVYKTLHSYEKSFQFAELNKEDFWDLKNSLDLAYKKDNLTKLFLEMYDIVNSKIIRSYINIDGLERLFSKDYVKFEWKMHLGLNYKKHSMKYYRDHFIHQVKDAYMMVCMLEHGGFYEKVSKALLDLGNSKISRYVWKMLNQQVLSPETVINRVLKSYCDLRDTSGEQTLLKDHYLHNIIYMASFMAGLFHDIGYPSTMTMDDSRNIIDYIAEEYHFGAGNCDFNKITAILQNSLLFRIVELKDIRKRIEQKKIDHGTVSALLFLLHFYENGAIHNLVPYKKCAIELAALSIYNHTNKYANLGQDNPNYGRCIFKQNPITYLLRLCDDIQEWGRVYFEINNNSNLIVCDKCHATVKRTVPENGSKKHILYKCYCTPGEKPSLFSTVFPSEQFSYRRLYNITVCQEVELITRKINPFDNVKIFEDIKGNETLLSILREDWMKEFISSTKENIDYSYNFYIKYDLKRLLHIAYLNPAYARHRTEELSCVKKFFTQQEYLPMVFVDYLVTANIIYIKSTIVGEYIKSILSPDFNKDLDTIRLEDIFEKNSIQLFKNRINNIYDILEFNSIGKWDVNREKEKDLKNYHEKALKLYIFIYIIACFYRKANTLNLSYKENLPDLFDNLLKEYISEDKEESKFYKKAKELILNCNTIASGLYCSLDQYNYYPTSYLDAKMKITGNEDTDDVIYAKINEFIDIKSYKPDQLSAKLPLDAFTDLYIIREMLKSIKEKK